MEKMEKKVVQGAMLAAVVASLCCIIPLLFAGAGVAAIAIAGKFAGLHPYMLVVTALLFLVGFYYAYRPTKVSCEPGSACEIPASRKRARVGLWLTTAFTVVLTTFPYWSAALVRGTAHEPQTQAFQAAGAPVERVVLRVSGMTCEMCALGVESSLRQQPGVRSFHVSFSDSVAEVEYDPSQLSVAQIRSVIEKAGYQTSVLPGKEG